MISAKQFVHSYGTLNPQKSLNSILKKYSKAVSRFGMPPVVINLVDDDDDLFEDDDDDVVETIDYIDTIDTTPRNDIIFITVKLPGNVTKLIKYDKRNTLERLCYILKDIMSPTIGPFDTIKFRSQETNNRINIKSKLPNDTTVIAEVTVRPENLFIYEGGLSDVNVKVFERASCCCHASHSMYNTVMAVVDNNLMGCDIDLRYVAALDPYRMSRTFVIKQNVVKENDVKVDSIKSCNNGLLVVDILTANGNIRHEFYDTSAVSKDQWVQIGEMLETSPLYFSCISPNGKYMANIYTQDLYDPDVSVIRLYHNPSPTVAGSSFVAHVDIEVPDDDNLIEYTTCSFSIDSRYILIPKSKFMYRLEEGLDIVRCNFVVTHTHGVKQLVMSGNMIVALHEDVIFNEPALFDHYQIVFYDYVFVGDSIQATKRYNFPIFQKELRINLQMSRFGHQILAVVEKKSMQIGNVDNRMTQLIGFKRHSIDETLLHVDYFEMPDVLPHGDVEYAANDAFTYLIQKRVDDNDNDLWNMNVFLQGNPNEFLVRSSNFSNTAFITYDYINNIHQEIQDPFLGMNVGEWNFQPQQNLNQFMEDDFVDDDELQAIIDQLPAGQQLEDAAPNFDENFFGDEYNTEPEAGVDDRFLYHVDTEEDVASTYFIPCEPFPIVTTHGCETLKNGHAINPQLIKNRLLAYCNWVHHDYAIITENINDLPEYEFDSTAYDIMASQFTTGDIVVMLSVFDIPPEDMDNVDDVQTEPEELCCCIIYPEEKYSKETLLHTFADRTVSYNQKQIAYIHTYRALVHRQ